MEENNYIECKKCGKKFKSDGFGETCADCKRKNGTKNYLTIAIVVLVLGFIGGIMLGNEYPVKTLVKSSISEKYDKYEEKFNTDLMIYSWIAIGLLSLPIFGLNSICHRLDLLIDKDDKKKNRRVD